MKRLLLCLGAVAILTTSSALGATKPWQWTPAQASSALMTQAEDFYVETHETGNKLPRDLTSARCRGTGKKAAGRFTGFLCSVSVQRGVADPPLAVKVTAKTRKAGGLCWAVPPSPIPSGCLAKGKRGEGSVSDAFRAIVKVVGTLNQDFRCIPHGAGFFSCSWVVAGETKKGLVIFKPQAVVRVL